MREGGERESRRVNLTNLDSMPQCPQLALLSSNEQTARACPVLGIRTAYEISIRRFPVAEPR